MWMPAAAAHEDAGGARHGSRRQLGGMRSPHGAHHVLLQEVFISLLAISNDTLLCCIKYLVHKSFNLERSGLACIGPVQYLPTM